MKVGVLSIQGDVSEHLRVLNKLSGVEGVPVKYPKEISSVDALIVPGGESTTISKLLDWFNITDSIKDFAKTGKPLLGTCAGMVLFASQGCQDVEKSNQKLLGLIDAEVSRNAFGRQKESFEKEIEITELGEKDYPGVFIRAPAYTKIGNEVTVLAKMDNKIIAAKQENITVCAFHPELTTDKRFIEFFLNSK